MSNKYKCTYCREYGNLPCEECDKKAKEHQKIKAMSNTKFIKVDVSERLPQSSGNYFIVNELEESNYSYFNKTLNSFPAYDLVSSWLEEVPDRESEFIEMLEKVIHNSDVPHYLLDEAKELIQSVKQPK